MNLLQMKHQTVLLIVLRGVTRQLHKIVLQPVAPPLPGPVIPETCFYFPVVPLLLQGMKKCLGKVITNPDGTISKIPFKGTQVTELEHEPDN